MLATHLALQCIFAGSVSYKDALTAVFIEVSLWDKLGGSAARLSFACMPGLLAAVIHGFFISFWGLCARPEQAHLAGNPDAAIGA